MEPRISIITLGVRDLERAVRFYRDVLELPTSWEPKQGIAFFRTSGTCLALYPWDELEKDLGWEPAGQRARFGGVTLAHNVRSREEVDEVLRQAVAGGARIEKPAGETSWGGYSGYFSDSDGHLWEVASGAFEFNEDGSLRIP